MKTLIRNLFFVSLVLSSTSAFAFPIFFWQQLGLTKNRPEKVTEAQEQATRIAVTKAYEGIITEADIWGLEHYENNTANCTHIIRGYVQIAHTSDSNTYWFLVCLEGPSEKLQGTLIYNGIVMDSESSWWR